MDIINIKVMTFNVRNSFVVDNHPWDKRKQYVAELIERFSPDIIGTQEVTSLSLDWLKDRLAGCYGYYGVMRTVSPSSGEYSAIFYKNDRFKILKEHSFMLSQTPDIIGSLGWDAGYERICSWVELALHNSDNSCLRFFNTHLDNTGEVAREKGLQLILDVSAEQQNIRKLPTIITGDFNATPDSTLFKVLKEYLPLSSCYDMLSEQDKNNLLTYHDFKGGSRGNPIDYILYSKEIKIKSTDIIRDTFNGEYPSDHYPVMCELEVI